MTDQDALLRAVIENPDDDTPRLVYADWLEENGQPERAEFIRLQIELAVARREVAAVSTAVPDRVAELYDRHGDGWRQPFPDPLHRCCFERGFIVQAGLNAPQAADVLARLPRVSPVGLVRFLRAWTELGPSSVPEDEDDGRLTIPMLDPTTVPARPTEALAGLRGLLVFCTTATVANDAVASIAARGEPVSERVTLSFLRCQLGDAGARWLAESPVFERVAGVELFPDRPGVNRRLLVALHRRFGDRLTLHTPR